MTDRRNLHKMEKVINGDLQDLIVDSQFAKQLDNYLNSEIASRIIKTYEEVIQYFSNSLLYIQIYRKCEVKSE